MPFDTALSGIRAASSDLSVTGNNIANASTTGFKASRAEFGDVYATSVLGAGVNAIGSGVQVQEVAQRFSQGNVGFTENELDLAINGNGFFVVSQQGETLYTRAGSFGLDDEGYVVNNTGAVLQGFSADGAGNIGGIQGDIRIQTSNLAPRQTTSVESLLNLDSTEPVLQTIGAEFSTSGTAVGVTQIGRQSAEKSTLTMDAISFPIQNLDTNPIIFDVTLAGPTVGNNGTVTISLDSIDFSSSIDDLTELQQIVSSINSQLYSPNGGADPIDVVVSVGADGAGNPALLFESIYEGELTDITISIDPASDAGNVAALGLDDTNVGTTGIPSVSNGYPLQTVDIISPNGDVVPFSIPAGAEAASTASQLNALQGVSATARSEATLTGFTNTSGNIVVSVNDINLVVDDLADLEAEINALSTTSLAGITATVNAAGTGITVTSAVGKDLKFAVTGGAGDAITVQGSSLSAAQTLTVGGNGDTDAIVVGGAIDLVLEEGYSLANAVPQLTGIFQPFTPNEFTPIVINAFDPADQSTYNSATSMTIYDSLGNSHVMTQYFVKQDYDATDPTSVPNHWVMYARIDDADVGDPDTTLPPPANTQPTLASFDVYFNEDGSLNTLLTSDMLISNWTPVDESGQPNGALGPQNILAGGTQTVVEPPTSSNFVISLEGTTQFGSEFSVNDISQNGFSTGRLSGLNIADNGTIFARFTNGQSLRLGQVVLADFSNQQGLQPTGNTMWAETFESGSPNVGTPGSAALGAVQAGALEESNVDLSEQLVNLIIAQRNFQASAKTIETADAVTQTIINLR